MMNIERIILRRVAVELHEPFRISNGSVRTKESVMIELRGDGIIGHGEASPMSGTFYSSESPDSTWNALANDLVPELLARDFKNPIEYAEHLNSYRKEPFARAGIEGALWHFAASKEKTSIGSMMSIPKRPIASGLAVGLSETVDELLERIDRYLPRYQRLKIKIQPGWDIEPLSAIRARFGNIPLMVDANAAYNLTKHRGVLQELDAFNLQMIEQPLEANAFEEMAELQRTITTPLCADESADSQDSLERIIALGSAKIINIKVQRVGGLWNAMRMHDRATAAGLRCWLGTMPELGIASAQALEIASLPGFTWPTDIEASDRWFVDDIISPKIETSLDGFIIPISGIGMGYTVDVERLERYTISMKEFTA